MDGGRQMGRDWGTGGEGEGMQKYKWTAIKQSREWEGKHRGRSQQIVITVCGTGWALDPPGDPFFR